MDSNEYKLQLSWLFCVGMLIFTILFGRSLLGFVFRVIFYILGLLGYLILSVIGVSLLYTGGLLYFNEETAISADRTLLVSLHRNLLPVYLRIRGCLPVILILEGGFILNLILTYFTSSVGDDGYCGEQCNNSSNSLAAGGGDGGYAEEDNCDADGKILKVCWAQTPFFVFFGLFKD